MRFPHFKSSRKQFLIAFSFFMMLVGILLGTILAEKKPQPSQAELQKEQEIDTVTSHFTTSLEIYIQTLYGARGLMTASENVSREEWQVFYQNIGVARRLPGLAAIGYVQYVPLSERAAFEDKNRAQDDETISNPFEIRPNSIKPHYNVLTYIAPMDTEALRSTLGFDYDSEIIRKTALEKARDLNQPTVAAPILTLGTKLPGFLIVLPVYNKNLPKTTTAERLNAYQGAIMVAFRNQELFNQAFSELDLSTISVKIYDGENVTSEHLMYDSANGDQILGLNSDSKTNTRRTVRQIQVADRTWTLEYHYVLPDSENFIFPSIYSRIMILALTNFVSVMVVYHLMLIKKA